MPNDHARSMALLRTINEKLDLAITGHGHRIQRLESADADKETRLSTLEQTVKWLVRKIESRK